jgi:Kef-type K+ transport system membrane component KefB
MTMWLFQLALIIAVCACFGRIAEQLGQCRVVGEIAAGIFLGPSVVGGISPRFYDLMFGAAASSGMSQLGEVGVVLLMFQIGLHMDFGAGRADRSLKVPLTIAACGMALPFAGGVLAAIASRPILAPHLPALRYILFCGVALSVSAVPVMARIVTDMRLTHYPAVKQALSAAMFTDIAGWLLLAGIASISVSGFGQATLLRTLAGLTGFVAISLAVSRFFIRPYARHAVRTGAMGRLIGVVVPYMLVSAWATSALGMHSAFGSLFAAVMLRGIPELQKQWSLHFDGFVRVVLLPVFFAYAGLHVSISGLDGSTSWLWFGIFLCIAFIGKFGGSYLGARVCGMNRPDAAIVGSLMNTRGLMELIVLSIGLQMHALPQGVYAILVFVALVTTAMTVPFIRRFSAPSLRLAEQQRLPE